MKFDGRQYGFLHSGNDERFVKTIPNQQIAGYSVGIVYIEQINYPLMPGNVVNAHTFDFPVRMKAVPNLTNTRLFEADPTIADDIISAAKHMVENEGVRTICSACGFFGNYHKVVSEALDVPVALSSLVQVPLIQSIIGPNKKVGILTANESAVNDNLYKNCGIERTDNLIVQDTLGTEHFSAVVEMTGEFDNGEAKREVLEAADNLMKKDKDIGAILLECSDMPPYAAAIQERTQLPVYDFITLIKWLHSSVAQKPYSGWM